MIDCYLFSKMAAKFDNVLGLFVVLLPVLLLLYVTVRNVGWIDQDCEGKDKERFAGNVKNRNFDDPNWRNGVFYQNKDGQMLPTNPVSAPAFSVERFDNQVKGWSADGLDLMEGMETEVRETTLNDPNWLGGVFYQKRNELGRLVPTNPPLVGGELADTNDLREGFLDVGFGEALRDGLNTLIGRSDDRNLPSTNPDLAYVKTQPDIPFHDPRVGSVRDAPTAAVKIPVLVSGAPLVDDKPGLSAALDERTRGNRGLTMKELNAKMLADDAHAAIIAGKAKDVVDAGMDFIIKNNREIGFGNIGRKGKVPLGGEKGILQQLYGSGEAKGTIKSGKREFADDADTVKLLVSGKVVCDAYPIMRGGKLKQVNISNNGNDYKKAPRVKVVGGDAVRSAKLKAVIDGNGAVVFIDIEDEGEGYKTTPELKFV